MSPFNLRFMRTALLAATASLSLAAPVSTTSAQTPPTPEQQPSEQQTADDVVRVNTELVQTDVMVFDKQGRAIEDLQREQFELRVDGRVVPISFFERVEAGSFDEEAQLAAARGASRPNASAVGATRPLDRGRFIVFFVDDLHLSLDSLNRTRKSILNFIDKEMGQNDRVAVASASGQVGFLQQFTDNKRVLRAAVARLRTNPNLARDRNSPPMPEYMALSIERKEERGALTFYVEECLKAAPLRYPRRSCEIEVINRARKVLLEASSATSDTYAAFETLMRTSAQLPGRKLVFFISDGFLLHTGPRNADPANRLRRVTEEALRAGVVVYTIYARGLTAMMSDAANSVPFDANGRLEQSLLREIPASQDAMHALAADTGGQALRNVSDYESWVTKAVEETSRYYLLAWRPEDEEQRQGKFSRLEVSIKGRPELSVRMSRGVVAAGAATPPASAKETKQQPAAPKTPQNELHAALTATHTPNALPVLLNLSYLDTPAHGAVLTTSMQVAGEAVGFNEADGKQRAAVDVAGVVLNDKGKPVASFKTRLNVDALASGSASRRSSDVIYNHRTPLAPGLYQARVAARDQKSGRIGGAQHWVEIPDLASRQLTLSSLLIGLRDVETTAKTSDAGAATQVQFSVDHRFARASRLRFLTFVYNAPRTAAASPDLAIQAQIFRDDQPVVTTPLQKLSTEATADPARLPYEAEISLRSLPAGRYALQVTVIDRISKQSATQRADFEIQ